MKYAKEVASYVQGLIDNGIHEVTAKQFYKDMLSQYKVEVQATDYCYNRVNEDHLKKHHNSPYNAKTTCLGESCLLEDLFNATFKCLGLNYDYTGPVLHRPSTKKKKAEYVALWCIKGKHFSINK